MSKRTRRGGYKQPQRQGRARVKIASVIHAGGDVQVNLGETTKLTDRQRLAAVTGRNKHWRELGPTRSIEPLNAGLRRYVRFPQ